MQSCTDGGTHHTNGKTEIDNTLTTFSQSSSVISTSSNVTITQSSLKPVRNEKSTNSATISQNNRFNPCTVSNVTAYHIPRGTAAVANISVPRGTVSAPVVRAASLPLVQPSTISGNSTTTGFISTLSRPMTTWVVTNTTSSAILQKASTLNVVSSTPYIKPSNTVTVTSRITAPIVNKPLETTVKPIILQNTSKQLIAPTANQFQDRNTSGMLKTNVGMVTIRAPPFQHQARLPVTAQGAQPPKLTMSVPVLVPTATPVRKPQTLAPKVITQSTRSPFTVQSIPVSVSHTPSALTINKKTAGIAITNNQTITCQSNTTLVRSNPPVITSNSIITKVYPTVSDIRPITPSANLLIQTSKSQNNTSSSTNVAAFPTPSTPYMYDSENFQVKRTLVSSSTTAFTSSVPPLTTTPIPRHYNIVSSVNTNQISRVNSIMVVETPRMAATVTPSSPNSVQSSALTIQSYVIPQGAPLGSVQQQQSQSQQSQQQQRISPVPQQSTNIKTNASPRPSILRKREIDGSLTKAQRNLTPLLNSVPGSSSTAPPSPPSPHMPDNGGGQSSNSSSTLSATSSPGIPCIDPESPTTKSERPMLGTHCEEEQMRASSLIEISPRKKPRKQQLTGNLTNEPKLEDDMEFICNDKIKTEPKDSSDSLSVNQDSQKSSSNKKPNISILNGYNHGWKSRHHHFLRYSDIKYKEEKKSTVSDIANQKYVTQKINGWKIYHLGTQMEDLHGIEIEVVDKLSSLLKLFEKNSENDNNSLNRTNELIMGNIQRSKVISDQLKEAKTQMLKVFNHKKHVSDIINKYASKRTIKKKGRY